MLETFSVLAALFHYGVLLLFGVFVTGAFLHVLNTRKDWLILTLASTILILIQLFFYIRLDVEYVQKLYPVITHLPLALFFILFYKRYYFLTMLAISITYFCCQIVHWIELALQTLCFHSIAVDLSASLLLIILAYLLIRYVAPPIFELLNSSNKSLLIFSIVPFIYYLYYYACAVYTDLLYSANILTVEFFPFIICFAYLLFSIIYFREYEQHLSAEHQAQILKIQMAQYEILQIKMEETRRARHDLRQHLHLIQAYLDSGDTQSLKDYVKTYGQSLPEDDGRFYCNNRVADTVIRYYAQKAAANNIQLEASIHLPDNLHISEPDLCVLLGNMLENALEECERHSDEHSTIKISGQLRGTRTLIITVDNTPAYRPKHLNGTLLSSKTPGREGTGTLSIQNIARLYNGEASFEWKNDTFYASVILTLPKEEGSSKL